MATSGRHTPQFPASSAWSNPLMSMLFRGIKRQRFQRSAMQRNGTCAPAGQYQLVGGARVSIER